MKICNSLAIVQVNGIFRLAYANTSGKIIVLHDILFEQLLQGPENKNKWKQWVSIVKYT